MGCSFLNLFHFVFLFHSSYVLLEGSGLKKLYSKTRYYIGGEDFQFDKYFSMGLVQPPTRKSLSLVKNQRSYKNHMDQVWDIFSFNRANLLKVLAKKNTC